MNLKNILIAVWIAAVSFGCTVGIVDAPQAGMTFNADIWADKLENGTNTRDPDNFYLYVMQTADGVIYKKNPKYPSDFKGGILVLNRNVVKVLSQADINNAIALAQQQQKIAQAKEAQKKKITQARADQAEAKRLSDIRNRKYSILPAKYRVQTQGNAIAITSTDDEPFLLERVVVNNRVAIKSCDKGNLAEYMTTGDSRVVYMGFNCGSSFVKIEVYTNRGSRVFGD